MMAPDPPREDRHHQDHIENASDEAPEDTHLQPGTFLVDWNQMVIDDMDEEDELMFVPQGPHELDMGGSESEYSTDDDEDGGAGSGQPHPTISASENNHPTSYSAGADDESYDGRVRGHYQLLIPFPAAQRSDSSSGTLDEGQPDISTNRAQPATSDYDSILQQNVVARNSRDEQAQENAINDEQISNSAEENDEVPSKREINLTEEKVATIKSVMQSFTLPSTSIPPWASEFDEDSWKKRLTECIDSKTNNAGGKPK